MLRRTLFLALLLGVTTPAQALLQTATGNIQPMGCMLEIGYVVNVKDQSPLMLSRVTDAPDPFRTYAGCRTTDITCNFRLMVVTNIRATSVAQGDWKVNHQPQRLDAGTTPVEFCVRGDNIRVERLTGGTTVKVAELRISIIPLE